MIEAFDLAQVHRSPARFDFAKLENMNGNYTRAMDDDALTKALIDTLPHLPGGPAAQAALNDTTRAQLRAAMPGLKARAKTLVELLDGAQFIFAKRPLTLDAKAQELVAAGRANIAGLLPMFEALAGFNATTTDAVVRAYAERTGAKLGQVAQPLRAALTGRSVSPPIFDVLEGLGKEESLARLRDQAAQ